MVYRYAGNDTVIEKYFELGNNRIGLIFGIGKE
jgi:hypothetical protein